VTKAFKIDRVSKVLGQRVQQFRKARRFSQQRLADQLGVSFQQVQKYECGANRISVPMLLCISEALKIPVMQLLDTQSPENDIPLKCALAFAQIQDAKSREHVASIWYEIALMAARLKE
jgi:transcriptional regulator with XRE-family HTH domain